MEDYAIKKLQFKFYLVAFLCYYFFMSILSEQLSSKEIKFLDNLKSAGEGSILEDRGEKSNCAIGGQELGNIDPPPTED